VTVTPDAQSPFTNVYPAGSRGVRIAAEQTERLGIRQNLVPMRTPAGTKTLHLNIDFRTDDTKNDGRSYPCSSASDG
jgi:hypothetical protein